MAQADNTLDAPEISKPSVENAIVKWLRRIAIVIELAIWAIGALAMLFKLNSWEGSRELFTLFFTLLALFYLLFTFLVSFAKGRNQIAGAIATGISLFLALAGALFVLNSWRDGKVMLISGLVLGGIAFVTTLYLMLKAKDARHSTKFFWNILVRLAVVFLFTLV